MRAALAEDLGAGDLTAAVVPAALRARARLVAKAPGVVAGLGVFARAFLLLDDAAQVEPLATDGDEVRAGDLLARVEGSARALLAAERTALNFLQRLSGTATAVRELVRRAGGVPVLDTRKTTPGLRALEKYAVRCGGGRSHRAGLWDEAMVKENHVEVLGRPSDEIVRELRAAVGPETRIHAEARSTLEALAALRGGADVVLLDNMEPAEMADTCDRLRSEARRLGRTVEIEASGNVTPASIGAIARQAGVDRISAGGPTHSAPALDLSLLMEPAE